MAAVTTWGRRYAAAAPGFGGADDEVTDSTRYGMICRMEGQTFITDATTSDQLIGEAEFLRRLSCPAESIATAVANGTIFFVMKGGQKLYPSFFADSAYERRQLAAVAKLLKDLDGFTKWQFFVTGKGSLGGLTPLSALRQGRLRQVRATAEGFAER